jgi:menaquinone-dependent protoporphyrinogen IX oxidase
MKQMSKVQGGPTDVSREYEYTDWSAVESFSQTLAAGFGGGNGGHSP